MKILERKVSKLEIKNKELLLINKELSKSNEFLRKRITELEDKLNIDSSNSGIPTSKEIYKKEKRTRPKSNRNVVGQPGHKHNKYKRRSPDKIINVCPKEKVCSCGGILEECKDYSVHQKLEIPKIKPHVTEYRLKKKTCKSCQKQYKGKLDKYSILGSNAQSILSSLCGCFNTSKRDVQSILSQIFNLDISLGLISKNENRVSAKLEANYNKLVEESRSSFYLNMDETSHNNKGKRYWCWLVANSNVTVFKLTNSRGGKVIKNLLPSYNGKVISDRYAVYNCFSSSRRQICLAHLRRDFKRFAHSKNTALSNFGNNLLDSINLVFAYHKAYKKSKIIETYFLKKIKKVKKKIFFYLKKVSHFSCCEQACRVAKNILKSFDMMWLFTKDKNIPPTNNFAERQIKNHVKYRKNSFFTWSDRADRFLERIKSIYATAKLRNSNPFLVLQSLIQNSS